MSIASSFLRNTNKIIAFVLLISLIVPSLASLHPTFAQPNLTVNEWTVPTPIPPPFVNNPLFLTIGPSGNLFFTESPNNKIGELSTNTNTFREWTLPIASTLSFPLDIQSDPSSGLIWFTEPPSEIGSLNPVTNVIQEFPIPSSTNGAPRSLAIHSNKIFFTEAQTFGNAIGMLDPATGILTEWANPTPPWITQAITLDASGNVYFTQLRTFVSGGDRIGRLDVSTNTFTVWTLPGDNVQPQFITVSSGKVFVTEFNDNSIMELDPATNLLRQFSLPLPPSFATTGPSDLIVDTSGNIQFTERLANKLGTLNPTTFPSTSTVITPTSTTVTPTTTQVTPTSTTVTPLSTSVLPITTSVPLATPVTGLEELIVPTPNSEPLGIAVGSGGTIFVTEAAGNKILQVVGQQDSDQDGVPDSQDNCLTVPNANQLNTDGDALGDACDPDDDNDGINDNVDQCPTLPETFNGFQDTDGCPDVRPPSKTVGGEILPIDMTSLLIMGVLTNAYWVLPFIVLGALIAFIKIKMRKDADKR